MMTFIDPLFWVQFIYFLIAILLAFFIPGDLFIRRLNVTIFQRVIISTVLGMVFWSIQGYIFGYLHMRWLTYLYLLVFLILWISHNVISKKIAFSDIKLVKNSDWFLFAIIIVGVSIQFISIGFNGIFYNNALQFCCGLPDSIYHIALVNALVKNVPPFEPGMYDVAVSNYHYLSNLSVAELIRIFKLPLLYTQNQYIPVLVASLIGFSAIVLSQVLHLNKIFTRWLVFFLYFYGDIIFLISFLVGNGFQLNYTLQENATTIWVSPPRVFGLVIFLIGLTLLILWVQKKKLYTGILMAFMMGSLIGIKVYIGIFAMLGLAALGCYYLFTKQIKMLLPLFIAVIISAFVYLPPNNNSGGLFFSGLWRVEDFIVNPAYNLSHLELARKIYVEHANHIRIVQYEILYFLLYIPSLLGIFLLGFYQTKKSLSQIPLQIHVYLLFGTFFSTILGVFFLQEIGGANTSQFLFPLYIVGAFYTSLTCSTFIHSFKNPLKIFLICLIVFLTIGRVLYATSMNLSHLVEKKSVIVNEDELNAFAYINTQLPKSSVILLANKGKVMANETYYISFMVNKPFFLVGGGILHDHGVDMSRKVKVIDTLIYEKDPLQVGKILLDNKIDYVYGDSGASVSAQTAYFLKPIFKNKKATVFKVQKESIKTYIIHPNQGGKN